MTADLDQDHRLDARGCAHRAHESARIADAFDIHQDAVGIGIGHQIIQYLTEVHIGR